VRNPTETEIRFGRWLLANAEDALGRTLTDEECDLLFDALGHSSIPDALETIVSNVEVATENALDVTPQQLVDGFGPEDFD
jgi:hypothetical protein